MKEIEIGSRFDSVDFNTEVFNKLIELGCIEHKPATQTPMGYFLGANVIKKGFKIVIQYDMI